MNNTLVDGLIIGCRKCATSWLHENFLKDEHVSTTLYTKETRFFTAAPTVTIDQYKALFQPCDDKSFKVECDASICYESASVEKIKTHASNVRLVLILRNPYSYLVSRFIHSRRKGEINSDLSIQSFLDLKWVQQELDYAIIINRFQSNFEGNLMTLKYESIDNEDIFYSTIVNHLSSGKITSSKPPLVDTKVNFMRSSKFPFASQAFTRGASLARSHGLHGIVSKIKNSGIHKIFEVHEKSDSKNTLLKATQSFDSELLLNSYNIWKSI